MLVGGARACLPGRYFGMITTESLELIGETTAAAAEAEEAKYAKRRDTTTRD